MAERRGWVGFCLGMMVLSFMIGFSLAMALVGDSPWAEFWLRMARCCK
jgi:hypothetical protein